MIPDDWGRPDGRPLGVVVLPFRPTSRIEGRGPHHHVEAARRWYSYLVFVGKDFKKYYAILNAIREVPYAIIYDVNVLTSLLYVPYMTL